MTKQKVVAMSKKLEFYEGIKKLLIEVLVEVISGVIAKLISGGSPGRSHPIPRAAETTT